MSLNTNTFITLNDVAKYVSFDNTNQDEVALLEMMINSATTWIEKYIRKPVKATTKTYKQFYNLYGKSFVLPTSPVISVSSLNIDLVPYTVNVDFLLNSDYGIIELFQPHSKNCIVECSYVSGFTVIPDDIISACLELVAYNKQKNKTSSYGVKSTLIGENTISYELDIPLSIKRTLDRYKLD